MSRRWYLLREVIKLGLLDELELHVAPVILGAGMRLLDANLNLGDKEGIELAPIRVIKTHATSPTSAIESTATRRGCGTTGA